MIEALVFDMDGLIFDSERIVQRSWEAAGIKLGFLHLGGHIYNTLGMNVHSRRKYFAEHEGEDFPYDDFAMETSACFREIVEKEGLPVKPGVRELLSFAKEKGLKLALATSSRSVHAFEALKEARLYDFFDGYVCGDMVHRSKPDPEIYQLACESIGVSPDHSIALEDSPAGIRSAYGAGMRPIMVPDLVQPDAEISRLLFRKFDTLLDVIPLLEKTSNIC